MKKILHIFEAAIANTALFIFGIMPVSIASNIGGFLGKIIGFRLKVTTLARNNIKRAMPELSDEKVEEILLGMWDNLGRTIAEYSHISKLTKEKVAELVTIEGQENLDLMKKDKGCFLMTGHFGNWEMIAPALYYQKCPLHIVYRVANNPYVNKIISEIRQKHIASASPKGSVGARQIIKSLQKGGHIIMLVDQKQNDGIAVQFFGRDAMTAPAIATLSRKYNANIYPARIVRLGGGKFKVIFLQPISATKSDNAEADILKLMTTINKILEDWIRQNPEQWFWVHNRWPKEAQ